jgi:hypothetical protein
LAIEMIVSAALTTAVRSSPACPDSVFHLGYFLDQHVGEVVYRVQRKGWSGPIRE